MKVTLWMTISLNGIIATLDNREDFLSHQNWKEFIKAVNKTGCLIWGRRTYEIVRNWEKYYLEPLQNIIKIIISSNPNLKLDKGFYLANSPENALEILKKQGFKEVILTGGSVNNSSFAKLGLISEVVVDIEGIIIGKGIPLFNPDDLELPLQLIKVRQITPNIIQLQYKVAE